MLISDLLSPEKIHCDVHSSSKKRLLELISEELARNSENLSQREISFVHSPEKTAAL